jgi:dipeptidase D
MFLARRLYRRPITTARAHSGSMAPPAAVPAAAPDDDEQLLAAYADPADAARAAEVAALDPPAVFSRFAQLARIPRPSGAEHRALSWIKGQADALGLTWQQDARGNLVVRRPAGPGREHLPGVILQGHVDMVTENNADVAHDWLRDPVRLRVTREGGEEEGEREGAGGPAAARKKKENLPPPTTTTTWLRAHGTTLGADNGIGLCAALAVLALPRDAPLPPIEALVTVEEETGLKGASALDASMLRGRVLLNLDSEQWPEVTVGCAGAGDTLVEAGGLAVEPIGAADAAAAAASATRCWLRLTVDGLGGGHSGLQIAEGRGNAVQMLASAARAARRAAAGAAGGGVVAARLGWVDGGDKRNAIAREARCDLALVVVAAAAGGGGGGGGGSAALLSAAREAATAAVGRLASCWREEYGAVEPALRVALVQEEEGEGEGDAEPPAASRPSLPPLELLRARRAVLRDADAERVLALLSVLPHGPVRFSTAMPGLVETSNNTASVKLVAAASAAAEDGEEEEEEEEEEEGGASGRAPPPSSPSSSCVRALVQVSTRSSYPHALEEQRERVALAARGAGATRVLPGEPYAGWAPEPRSRLARLVARCVAEVEAEDRGGGGGGAGAAADPAAAVPVVALHAGLECGVLRERLLMARGDLGAAAAAGGGGGGAGDVEVVSFGPTILGAHSPEERADVGTVGKFWRALLKVLEELGKA